VEAEGSKCHGTTKHKPLILSLVIVTLLPSALTLAWPLPLFSSVTHSHSCSLAVHIPLATILVVRFAPWLLISQQNTHTHTTPTTHTPHC
jgi:hypothetical protein